MITRIWRSFCRWQKRRCASFAITYMEEADYVASKYYLRAAHRWEERAK